MHDYEVLCFNSNHRTIDKDNLKTNIEDFINSNREATYNCQDYFTKLKTFLPIFNNEGDLDRYYVIFGNDDPKYTLTIITNTEEFDIELTKYKVDVILSCNKITYDTKEYEIIDKTFDIEKDAIICKCEEISK